MIILGIYYTGKIPFKYVYLHGLVRDKDRQKCQNQKVMLLILSCIDVYGADALRMALIIGNTAGNDIVISEEKSKVIVILLIKYGMPLVLLLVI